MSLMNISIKRNINFSGKRKVGLDSCVIIDMMEYFEMLSYISNLLKEKDLLYTHEICVEEIIKILADKTKTSVDETRKEVIDFLKQNNINIIKKDKNNILYKTISIHKPDCFIIADWKKQGINLAYSQNNHFNEACILAGISAVKIPTFDKLVEKKLKELFKLNKKR